MSVLVVGLVFLLILCAAGGLVVLASRGDRQRLIASAPPGALVGADDTSAEARAKLAQYRSTQEAARLLQALLVKDDAALFLNVEERRDIKAWLEHFYGRGPS
jgi:hypothetical protein